MKHTRLAVSVAFALTLTACSGWQSRSDLAEKYSGSGSGSGSGGVGVRADYQPPAGHYLWTAPHNAINLMDARKEATGKGLWSAWSPPMWTSSMRP